MSPLFENSLTSDSTLAYGVILAGLLADHILVACRLLGLLVTIPGFNHSSLSWHLKILLLVVTAAVITPNVSPLARSALRPAEPQRPLAHASEPAVRLTSHSEPDPDATFAIDGNSSSAIRRSTSSFSALTSGLNFLVLGACEVCLGLMLGLGANLVLQGFRIAGQLIDQQTGWGLVATSALDSEEAGTATGELFYWLGAVLLFALGGHLLLISSLLETFRTFPPGSGSVNVELIPVFSQLVHQSLSLALQLSAPVLATQVLAALILSHAGAIAPHLQQAGTGVGLRIVLATFVLVLTLSGMADRLMELIPATIQTWIPALASTR